MSGPDPELDRPGGEHGGVGGEQNMLKLLDIHSSALYLVTRKHAR
jgi:hypothetical protein